MQTWIFPLLYIAVSRFTLLCICFLWSGTRAFNPDRCSFTFHVILLAKLLEELSTWFNGAKSKTTILGLFIQSELLYRCYTDVFGQLKTYRECRSRV